MELQPKLLRALESREIRRVGGRNVIHCDLRIISATNRDLRAEVNRGRSARSLLPPRGRQDRPAAAPRARRGHPLLVRHLLHKIGAAPAVIGDLTSPDFLAALSAARWPGNVRELRNHLEQCVVFGERRLPNAPAILTGDLRRCVAAVRGRPPPGDRRVRARLRRHAARPYRGQRLGRGARRRLNRAYLHRLLRRHGVR